MKSKIFLGLPVALLVFMHFLLRSGADMLEVVDLYAEVMPMALFGTALLLSLLFGRSKLAFLSVLLGSAAFYAERCCFQSEKAITAENFVLVAVTILPVLIVVLYFLRERGVLNRFALMQLVLVGAGIAIMAMTPELRHGGELPSRSGLRLLRPVSVYMQLPAISLAVLPLSCLAMLIRKERESTLTGPLLCIALLFVFSGLNAESELWKGDHSRSAMALFMSGAAATLIWTVLEGSWRSATMDRLTQLPGRHAFDARIDQLAGAYVLVMVDLDKFKKVNDTHGHQVGDQVLRYVASTLSRFRSGTAYRYGGEEFVLVCPGKSIEKILPALETLREEVSGRKFVLRGTEQSARKGKRKKKRHASIRITVSIGAAEPTEKHSTPAEVLEAADKALYTAKRAGRNKVKKAR